MADFIVNLFGHVLGVISPATKVAAEEDEFVGGAVGERTLAVGHTPFGNHLVGEVGRLADVVEVPLVMCPGWRRG